MFEAIYNKIIRVSILQILCLFVPTLVLLIAAINLVAPKLDNAINGEKVKVIIEKKIEPTVGFAQRIDEQRKSVASLLYRYRLSEGNDALIRVAEPAPILYYFVEEGDELSAYYMGFQRPRLVLSHPLHFWASSAICLFFLFIFLFLAIKSLFAIDVIHTPEKSIIPIAVFGVLLLALVGIWSVYQYRLYQEELKEEGWPSWEKFESAVPKPRWWRSTVNNVMDPLTASDSEYRSFWRNLDDGVRSEPDFFRKHFKLVYAAMLIHKDKPELIAAVLSTNHIRLTLPLFEFYFSEYFNSEWEGDCSWGCTDDDKFTSLGAVLSSLYLDLSRVAEAEKIINRVLERKYRQANVLDKVKLFYEQVRLEKHRHGEYEARKILQSQYQELLEEMQENRLVNAHKRLLKIWDFPTRAVGGS